MKKNLLFLAKLYLYWFLVFFLGRILFIIYYLPSLKNAGVSFFDILACFPHGFHLDWSAASYCMIFSYLLMSVKMFMKSNIPLKINNIFVCLLTIIYMTMVSGELGMYGEWQSKLNYKALLYLQHPDEIFNSTSTGNFFLLLSIVIASSSLLIWFYYRFIALKNQPQKAKIWQGLLFIVLMPVFIFWGMRGSFKPIPIQQSDAFFSEKNMLNDLAVNTGWNLLYSYVHGVGVLENNPYVMFDQAEAQAVVKTLHEVKQDETKMILTTDRPNIVIILLESWSADMIESLGGDPGITPNFKKMEAEGILFTKAYAAGKRSQQGVAALFAGFPALPSITITEFPEKVRKLPSLTARLNQVGYHSSFYFGGQLMYGNIKGFLLTNQFQRIMEESGFSANQNQKGKLGIHDEFVLARHIKDMSKESQPFFSTVFTLSSHSPYDQPIQNHFDWNVPEINYINSVYYTDYALGKYIAEAKKTAWYKNTLFIFVADHSHNTHRSHPYFSFEYNYIPMMFYGEVIKPEYRGIQMNNYVTQSDLPATILRQLDMSHDEFTWSRNILNPYSPTFNYMEALDGVGFIRPEGHFFYNGVQHYFIEKQLPPESEERIIKEGQSYLQVLFQQVIDL